MQPVGQISSNLRDLQESVEKVCKQDVLIVQLALIASGIKAWAQSWRKLQRLPTKS